MRSRRLAPPVVLAVAALVLVALLHSTEIRERAAAGLGRGMPAREAELARGFVLGEDEDVDATTAEDFRRSGLSHLLAVSGQNVVLLALLAMPVLAAFGIPLRERLVWVLALIAVYVPLAGAGPTIQRAAVMGAAGLLATLSGRRASRLYALALALVVTLAVDPGVAADVGWQLSFAAVVGIFLLSGPLREGLAARIGSSGWRHALAEGAAVTIAATLATAPLIAFHFGTVSTTTLVANLLALPAVAPAMWLGMLAAAGAQVPGFPVTALNALNAPLLAYIAQVAAWCGRPHWAYLQVQLGGAGLAASYAAMAVAIVAAMRLARRRRIAALRNPRQPEPRPPRWASGRAVAATLVALALAVATLAAIGGRNGGSAAQGHGLRVEVLDVGQGDSILLQPADAPAVLVDGGPPGDELARKLRDAGVDRLGAVVATHDQLDHVGGIEELLGQMPIGRFLYAAAGRRLLREARIAGVPADRLAEGGEVRSGRLRLQVLWPPRELLADPPPGADPNGLALVILARWLDFSILLTADAEAEAVPIDPGPVDVLKVAHHGSDDSGLGTLLDRTEPKLAVISVGAANPYGHPTPGTLATLDAHGVRTLRTDRDGDIVLEVHPHSVEVDTGG
jgi:competence protein ComEC